jgi:hypothetical protein
MKHILFLSLILVFSACFKYEIQPEDLKTEANANAQVEIVIDAYISTEKDLQPVRLSKPNSWNNLTFTPISGAQISLSDGTTTFNYVESTKSGIYHSKDSIKGIVGKKYTLTVKSQNKEYFAADSLVAVSDFTSKDLPIKEIETVGEEQIQAEINENNFGYIYPSAFFWNDGYVDSLGNYQIQKVGLYQPSWAFLHKGALPQGIFPSGFRNSFGFSGEKEQTVEFTKLSLSPKFYNYIISVKNSTDWAVGLFATVPGNTFTNISKGGTGYFFATDLKRKRFKYKEFLP